MWDLRSLLACPGLQRERLACSLCKVDEDAFAEGLFSSHPGRWVWWPQLLRQPGLVGQVHRALHPVRLVSAEGTEGSRCLDLLLSLSGRGHCGRPRSGNPTQCGAASGGQLCPRPQAWPCSWEGLEGRAGAGGAPGPAGAPVPVHTASCPAPGWAGGVPPAGRGLIPGIAAWFVGMAHLWLASCSEFQFVFVSSGEQQSLGNPGLGVSCCPWEWL